MQLSGLWALADLEKLEWALSCPVSQLLQLDTETIGHTFQAAGSQKSEIMSITVIYTAQRQATEKHPAHWGTMMVVNSNY